MSYTLVLLRHGESEWNAKNLFTGWVDVRRSPTRVEPRCPGARHAAPRRGVLPDVVHTSVQRRAINTAAVALDVRRPPLDPRASLLATQRAPLRRPPGEEQEGDARRSTARTVASYGSATDSSGVVRILKDLDIAIEGRDVLIVEDIVDFRADFAVPVAQPRLAQSRLP